MIAPSRPHPLSAPKAEMKADRPLTAKEMREDIDPQLRQAAEGMEAMFLDYMMKVMRDTVPKNEMGLESAATGIYRGMLDSEYAQTAARQGGIGIADQIIAYWHSQGYNSGRGQRQAPPVAPKQSTTQEATRTESKGGEARTGGTRHEGQPVRFEPGLER